jgi:hypothetical protein
VGKVIGSAGTAYGIYGFLKAVYEGLQNTPGVSEKVVARALGSEAYRTLNDFYAMLNREVDKYYEEHEADYSIKFDNAKDRKPFNLFGTPNVEIWTLNMTLFPKNRDNKPDIDGWYEGQYRIDVEYDLSGFKNSIMAVLEREGWVDKQIHPVWRDVWGNFDETLINPGTYDVKSKQEGYATARIIRKYGNSSITPERDSFTKDASIADIIVEAFSGYKENDLRIEYTITADADNFTALETKWGRNDYYHVSGDDPEHSLTVPWDGYIWRRAIYGDKAWKISLTPLYRK